MPGHCHQELMSPLTRDVAKEAEFEGYNMEAMAVLVSFLNNRLDQNPVTITIGKLIRNKEKKNGLN